MFPRISLATAAVVLSTLAPAQTSLGNSNPREFTRPSILLPRTFFFAAPTRDTAALCIRPGATPPFDVLATFPIAPGMSGPSELTGCGVDVFFAADDGLGSGDELWFSNGTAVGTQMVRDIRTGPMGSRPQELIEYMPGMFLFTADDGVHGRELWKTDGTFAGTTMVKDIFVGAIGSFPLELMVVDNEVWFSANCGLFGRELWRTNGTAAGTVRVTDIAAGGTGSFPTSFARIGPELLYAADDGVDGSELWKTDTNTLVTAQVADIDPIGASRPRELTEAFGRVYFTADDGSNGAEVWRSDGTTLGTLMVADLVTVAGVGSEPYGYTANGSSVWFGATDGVSGTELWHINAAEAVSQVADINPTGGSVPQDLVTFGANEILFTATNGVQGRELYRATSAFAGMIRDLRPGECGAGITSLTVFGTTAMFGADEGDLGLGHDFYQSDGTFGGTGLYANVNPTFDNQPQLDHGHALQSGQNLNLFKLDNVDDASSNFVMISARAASPLDIGPLIGLQSFGNVTIDLGAFFFSLGPVSPNPQGQATFPPLPYPATDPAFEIVSQGLSFTGLNVKLSDNLAICQGELKLDGIGCPPGTSVMLEGSYVDDRLDYCLSVGPSSDAVTWVVFVKVFADGSCKELGRVELTGEKTTFEAVRSLKLGEWIEARFYCGKPNDDCKTSTGYVACRLGC